MTELWVRSPSVRARLARGHLALHLGGQTVVLDAAEARVWRAWTPSAHADELTASGLPEAQRRALWARLADAGMIEPEAVVR